MLHGINLILAQGLNHEFFITTPIVSQYYIKPTNDPTTQHIFIDVKRQLKVSVTKKGT
jgi:hypothetical protein